MNNFAAINNPFTELSWSIYQILQCQIQKRRKKRTEIIYVNFTFNKNLKKKKKYSEYHNDLSTITRKYIDVSCGIVFSFIMLHSSMWFLYKSLNKILIHWKKVTCNQHFISCICGCLLIKGNRFPCIAFI